MSRERASLLVSLGLSVLLHLLALFRLYVGTVPQRTLEEGEGRVALIKAVILAPAQPANQAGAPAAEPVKAEPAPPLEEAPLKLQKTELSLPAVPPPRETPPETVSTVPEVASAQAGPQAGPEGAGQGSLPLPADVSTEGTEPAKSGTQPAAGEGAGDGMLITHVPKAPEAAPEEPAIADAEPRKPAKAGQSAPGGKPPEEGGKEAAERPAAPQDLPDTARFVPVYRVDRKPELTRKAVLSYPAKARELNIQGTVILEVNIDEKGKVGDIRVVKSVGFGLDEEAVRWMRASAFTPAYTQDKPVAVRMQYPVTFTLK